MTNYPWNVKFVKTEYAISMLSNYFIVDLNPFRGSFSLLQPNVNVKGVFCWQFVFIYRIGFLCTFHNSTEAL